MNAHQEDAVKDYLPTIAKALTAAVVAGVGAGATAAIDDRITYGEWWMIAAAAVGALGAVWAVPNAEPAHGEDH